MTQLLVLLLAASSLFAMGDAPNSRPVLNTRRHVVSDLEIVVAGVGSQEPRYIAYEDLLKLPQVRYTISDDSNLPGETTISGVELAELAKSIGAPHDNEMAIAICRDGYRANYPTAYLRAHEPLLVLKINGKPPADWPRAHDGGSLGPYLISHPKFTPSFKILSHEDEPQIPFGVTRIEYRNEKEVFDAIRPPGVHAMNSRVSQGYGIAKQNCYRCHNMWEQGGHLAAHPWQVLAAWAYADPKHFRNYVRNPRSVNAGGHMPGNPEYDDATLDALTAYFSTFAQKER